MVPPMRRCILFVLLALTACGENQTESDDGPSSGSPSSTSAGVGGAGGSMGMGGSGGGGAVEKPVVVIETSLGTMTVELEPELMPTTTENFLTYVDEGFYAETIVHRVVPDFVIQGGGYISGLTEKETHDPIDLETHPDLLHDYGAISMARTKNPNSATSQYFIVNARAGAHDLDGNYAAFGRLIEGADVLDAISAVPTESQGLWHDVPVDDVTVLSASRR
jgi:peptidyl-prolyl cis-trans isomerase A (cyclophilin A)